MKSSYTKTVVEITLVITGEEAAWLHEMMQIPINYDRPENESIEDSTMRHKFFDATTPI